MNHFLVLSTLLSMGSALQTAPGRWAAKPIMALADSSGVDRRRALGGMGVGLIASTFLRRDAAVAIGPVSMELSDVQYDAAECPPDLKAGRIGGAFGGTASKEVSQQCVKVSCRVNNPTDKPLKDVAVFGFVLDEKAGASVIANNPDLRSDSGQFAQIDSIPAGASTVQFFFVATTGKDIGGKLPVLTFKSLKGISYPGGARFLALSPCELDSLSPECEDESDEDRDAIRGKKMRY